MKGFIATATAATIATLLCACTPSDPPVVTLRPVNTVELHYDNVRDANRYFATVASRYAVDQAFRVGGKVLERRIDVGQSVKAGDVLARLDDVDYRLAEEAARKRLDAAQARARQAKSDWQRLQALKRDGSVSASAEEQAHSKLLTARAAAEAEARQLELARNQVHYTVLRAPISGVVTSLRFESGQVVAAGQPVIVIANEGEPEIIVDVPENHLEAFKNARYKASLASAPDEVFDVVLRELSAQAAEQTRTYRARLKPAVPRPLPLGATATLVTERTSEDVTAAVLPAAAITQSEGQPAVWVVKADASESSGTVELSQVVVHGYRSNEVLVSGPPAGTLVVTAGVQKMAPGLRVALPGAAKSFNVSAEVAQ
ncbi:efflux RND transporter periplasmic adaptor subunit [Zobellella sp. An-6]|uniref:efflux RND transporter periplasmic adaptor subunit n=1 Tax=Zobellella sp. An-6 TaxID=3400218 RepID=UPI004041D275